MVFLTRAVRLNESVRKWVFKTQKFNRYGLYHDDCLDEVYNHVQQEAVRRLPPDLYDQRVYRCIRAFQLEITKSYLPEDQWTKFEDPMQHYLQPYVKIVEEEIKEKNEWEAKYPQK